MAGGRGAVDASFLLLLLFVASSCLLPPIVHGHGGRIGGYVSAVGDPGMRRDGLRVAWEAWNFCNEVGEEAPGMGSPRGADCFDLGLAHFFAMDTKISVCLCLIAASTFLMMLLAATSQNEHGKTEHEVQHLVTEADNSLRAGDPFPGTTTASTTDVDRYAAAKEVYLGGKCQIDDDPAPWQFWMIMLKNGNLDTTAAACPENGRKARPFRPEPRFPCPAGPGCMNQPLVYHNCTTLHGAKLRGRLFGTYELDADLSSGEGDSNGNNTGISYYSVSWEKEVGKHAGWVFHHKLRTSKKYPWLMLYLRSDATRGFSGGYHYDTRGMSKIVPESPDFKVKVTLKVKKGGGPNSQFYLMDMGGCWKNDGSPCNGDTATDVTRYSEMIINPETPAWCRPERLDQCPPYHTFRNGTRVGRADATRFPYGAYHVYCSPGNSRHAEPPTTYCDPYSNPQPQEIVQILPHPVWGEYGYPTAKGQGWVGDPRAWELDVGAMSQALYFYQDPGTTPARRRWTSLDVGTEIYKSEEAEAEWTVSGFDILVPLRSQGTSNS